MNSTNCGSITGGWRRAEYINMTDAANSCPVRLVYYTHNSTCFCSFNIQLQDALHSMQLSYICRSFTSVWISTWIPVTVGASRCIYFTTSTSYYCLYRLTLHWRTSVCDSHNSKEPHLYFSAGSIPLHLQLCLCFPLPSPSCTFICMRWCTSVTMKKTAWKSWRYTSTSTQTEEWVIQYHSSGTWNFETNTCSTNYHPEVWYYLNNLSGS